MKGKKFMKYQVKNIKQGMMSDIYDKDVDRRCLVADFSDGKHTIRVRYMILANYNVGKQLEYNGEEYWGAEVDYIGYKKKPTIKNWAEFDRLAQEYVDNNGVEE